MFFYLAGIVEMGARIKLRVVSRKIYDYVRTDLKEIVFPSSLPDPPHIKKRQKLTWNERYLVSYLNRDSFSCTIVSNNCGSSVDFCLN